MSGELLKLRREELGLNTKEIADLLKIKADYLESIEKNSFDRLPVEVYTKGYIRCYAQYLSVDPEPIIKHYVDHISQPPQNTVVREAFSRRKSPKYFYLIPAFLVVFVFIFYFVSNKSPTDEPLPRVAPVNVVKTPTADTDSYRVQMQNAESEGTPPTSSDQQDPSAVETAASVSSDQQDPSAIETAASASSDQQDPSAIETAASASSDQQDPSAIETAVSASSYQQVLPAAEGHTLKIEAQDTTWISLKLEDDSSYEFLFQPGESKSWSFSRQAVLKIGNAGGITVYFDGRDLGMPGDPGQVITLRFP